MQEITDDQVIEVLHAVESGKAAKEAMPEIFRSMATGTGVHDALKKCAPVISTRGSTGQDCKIVDDRAGFVRERGDAALVPLMGVVMGEVRGSADGKVVSELLKRRLPVL